MKTRVYLAGPMRGIAEFNFPAFHKAADQLREFGFKVFSPAENDAEGGFDPTGMTGEEDLSAEGFSLRAALAEDLNYIARHADIVVVLPGWEKSSGVAAEIALARALSIPVVPYERAGEIGLGMDPKLYDVDALVRPWGRVEPGTPTLTIPSARNRVIWDETAKRLGMAPGEVRTTSTTGGQKGVKPERYNLLPPEPLAMLARHFAAGAAKYDSHQWRKGYEWSKSFDAMMRHAWAFWNGEDYDEETGSLHITAVAWHAFVLMQAYTDHPEHDDRYKAA